MVTTNLLKKIIITILIALGYLYGAFGCSRSEAAELIRVALVHDQTTAEISSDSDFVVQSGGAKTVVAKGKYFLHVAEGKLVLDKMALPAGPKPLPPPIVSNKPVPSEQDQTSQRPAAEKQLLTFGSTISLHALEGKPGPKVNQRSYKGFLQVQAEQGKLLIVNHIDLEQYLASVLDRKSVV